MPTSSTRWAQRLRPRECDIGYHNHTMEFRPQNGVVPFDELMRLTDPRLSPLKWTAAGCGRRWRSRYVSAALPVSHLHAARQGFQKTLEPVSGGLPTPACGIWQRQIDYHPIFAAARRANIKHCFVEHEGFDMPPMDASDRPGVHEKF